MDLERRRRLNSAAVARYRTTARGRETHRQAQQRYRHTAKGVLTEVRKNANRRGSER